MGWILPLNEFDYVFLYFPGLDHQKPNALSTILYSTDTKVSRPIEDRIPTLESSLPLWSSGWRGRVCWERLIRIILLRTLMCLNGLTLPALPLFMTVWTMILIQTIVTSTINSIYSSWSLKPVILAQISSKRTMDSCAIDNYRYRDYKQLSYHIECRVFEYDD